MNRILRSMVLPCIFVFPLWGQSSSILKQATSFLPSLTEIGFITGAVNTYVQTATLVRAVNKEIALAKSMSQRLDDLKAQTQKMVGGFESLSDINPYSMDSWASWLDRAQGLVTEETSDFTDILFNSVLKTLDERMTTGFFTEVNRGLSYDASQGQIGAVLKAYYMNRDYDANREKIQAVALNALRVSLLDKENELSGVNDELSQAQDPDLKTALASKAKSLEDDISNLEGEISDPAVGGTTTDRQIAFLMDLAQNLGGEITTVSGQLEKHESDLKALNDEWVLASKDKLPKVKDRSAAPSPVQITRPDIYDPTDADKVPAPLSDVDKPKTENTSETSSPTTLSDLLHLQNEIEFKRLQIMENALNVEMNVAQARAALLAVDAYQAEEKRNQRMNVTFGAENLAQALKK